MGVVGPAGAGVALLRADVLDERLQHGPLLVGRLQRSLDPLLVTLAEFLDIGRARPPAVGIRPAGGVKSFEVRKGREPRSLVDLTFTGPARWSREEAHALRSLVDVQIAIER